MIRIKKPGRLPAVLRTTGMAETANLCAAHDADTAAYRAGAKTFDFKRDIYGDDAVKAALRKAQHDKCAFCESKVAHISYGDVEHFRPKAGFKQLESDPLGRPGYYWLAYEWKNLFFCCQLCNQRFKRNLFPLRDPTRRACSHHDTLDSEEPLLIDPTVFDPGVHLTWKAEYPRAVSGSPHGQTTIELLGLDREELVQQRREYLRTLRDLRQARDLFRQRQQTGDLSAEERKYLTRIEKRIEVFAAADAPYAAMARAFFKDR